MKWFILFLVVAGVIGYYLYNNPEVIAGKPTTKSHHGAAKLLMQATLDKSESQMQALCSGMAEKQCGALLRAIESEDSVFTKYGTDTGGSSSGGRVSARGFCYGREGNLFMELAFNMEKKGEEWKIYELSWRPIR
jgi:hypothetical protein